LGILEYMRVPLPAARMTMLRGVADMMGFLECNVDEGGI